MTKIFSSLTQKTYALVELECQKIRTFECYSQNFSGFEVSWIARRFAACLIIPQNVVRCLVGKSCLIFASYIASLFEAMQLKIAMKAKRTSQYFRIELSFDLMYFLQYLEMRFDRSVRLLATVLFIGSQVLYISITIYAPALALSQSKLLQKITG